MKPTYLFILFIFCGFLASGQSTSIYGKVTDHESGEELLYANIVIEKNGVFATGGSTDFEGDYLINLDPGTYEIKISYTGYPDKEIRGFLVKAGQANKLDIQIKQGVSFCYHFHPNYKVPLIDIENTTSGHTSTSDQIRNQPQKNINQLLLNTPGVSITNF